jgi:hypothetical protein
MTSWLQSPTSSSSNALPTSAVAGALQDLVPHPVGLFFGEIDISTVADDGLKCQDRVGNSGPL